MIGLEDRQTLAQDIHTAHNAGARLHLACEIAGIDTYTLKLRLVNSRHAKPGKASMVYVF